MTDESSNIRVVALEETGWARLLFALLSQRFTGRAEFEAGGRVVFRSGFAVWSDHEVAGTGVSEILASAGMLSPEEAAQVRERAPDDSLDALDALAELGLVDEETAAMALRDQCEQRVISTAGLGGELSLHDDPILSEQALDRLEPSRTLRVINRGVRGYCSPAEAEQWIDHLRGLDLVVSRAYAKYGDRFGFDDAERAEVRLLASRVSFQLDDLMQISGLDVVRSLQLLYTLWSCNMLVEAGMEPEVADEDIRGGRSESSLVQELVVAKISVGAPPYEVLGLGNDAALADVDRALASLAQTLPSETLEELRGKAYAQRKLNVRTVAKKALADRRWERALPALRDICALEPSEYASRLDLAWAAWNAVERRGESEERALDEAISSCGEESDVTRARAQFYRGHMRKHQGRRDEALASFGRAAALDPRLIDAQRESRALSGGGGKNDSRPEKAAKKPKAAPVPKAKTGPLSKYWSGPWPFIWAMTGILFAGLIAAQIILRLDVEL